MSRADTLPLLGGSACLDFANTLEWRRTARQRDALATFEDLVRWSVRAGTLPPEAAEPLLRRAADDPAGAEACLDQAVACREPLYRAFSTIAAGGVPRQALDDVAEILTPLLAATGYEMCRRAARRSWRGDPGAPARVLWAIAWSAHDLLTGDELARVRECADGDCHWLFVDRSRNRSRRWCGMAACGNVAKARRHRRRHRGSPRMEP